MKKITIILSILLLIISCKKESKKEVEEKVIPKTHKGLFVKGTFDAPDNSIVLLQTQLIDKTFKTLKTTQIKDKKFSFSETIDEEKLYFIGFNSNGIKIPFIADNHETVITIDINNFDNTKVEGSTIQQEYTSFRKSLEKSKNKFVYKINYIKSNSNSILSAIILKQMLGKTKWRIEQNKKAYNFLTKKIKDSQIGKEINNFIAENEVLVAKAVSVAELSLDPKISNEAPVEVVQKVTTTTTSTSYRKKAPNFYAESINGNDISLKSITSRNKVVLVDFWASWCAPCRAESPHFIKLYKKYHSKGFDVIGVSEDKYADIDKWKNAVTTDGLPWHQVIDDNKRVAKMFGVKAIPHTVLLDQDGGIILNKKSSYTIERKLKEIFGF